MNIQTMNKSAAVLFLILAIGGSMVGQIVKPTDEKILFEGRVSKIGEINESPSGVIANYQLMEYEVVKVLQGYYADNKMIVDHVVLTGKEIKGIKPGSRVCVEVRKIKNLPERTDDNIIRSSEDKVEWFYFGHLYRSYKKSPCRIDL
jgi:hypothetical protein